MIPIRSDNPTFSQPTATWSLIAINVVVFLAMRMGGDEAFERRVLQYGAMPANLWNPVSVLMLGQDPIAAIVRGEVYPYPGVDPRDVRFVQTAEGRIAAYGRYRLDVVERRLNPWITLLTSMFMHAGWLHLIGNMWFLHIFGSSVEDVVGKIRYVVFYLLCGLAAAAAHIASDTGSATPFLGASGAISGVMGAYAVRFPRARVLSLVPFFGFWNFIHIPAVLFLGIYILEQIFMSLYQPSGSGGTAWWAHIGGFAAGFLLVFVFPVSRQWIDAFSRRRHSGTFGYQYADADDPNW